MKKLFCILLLSFFTVEYAAAHSTAYGAASKVKERDHFYRIDCDETTATCYTIYDNGSVDVFLPTGTIHGEPIMIVNNNTGEEVSFESLPDEIQGADYTLYADLECEDCD